VDASIRHPGDSQGHIALLARESTLGITTRRIQIKFCINQENPLSIKLADIVVLNSILDYLISHFALTVARLNGLTNPEKKSTTPKKYIFFIKRSAIGAARNLSLH
jgi:hypothetical protein